MTKPVKSEQDWRAKLGDDAYQVCRCGGTERAFTGKYWDCHLKGTYHCAACDSALFASDHKYDSGSGWPSFWQPINTTDILEKTDQTLGMARTEITCAGCDSHLGHVFPDGPPPTGLRYCVNSLSLQLKPA